MVNKLEPLSRKDIGEQVKRKVAPNAETSCKYCGLWTVKIMDSMDEYFKCAIDYHHRYCEGKCSKYKEKKGLFRRLFRLRYWHI